ncbi:MAG: hypothetical protein ONB24_07260 [candidate division KSB1 bacterium]|nr:hypothetical protein [candidate division KSB1 bacterium]
MPVSLRQRKLYIPRMSYEGAACMAAAFRSVGVEAEPLPEENARTYELARRYLSGDECLPEAVTLGGFLQVSERPDYDPERTAFLLPTSNGPCRYGHYLPLAKKVFHQFRREPVLFFAPTSADGYGGIGEGALEFVRTAWRALVAADILRKLYLKTRPFEIKPGNTDHVYHQSLDLLVHVLEQPNLKPKEKMKRLLAALEEVRDRFRRIPIDAARERVLIGIVGEIFCRHNAFSNNDLFRLIEKYGGVVWVSDIAEWVMYTNNEEEIRLKRYGKTWSFQMFGCKLRQAVMRADEHRLTALFIEDFRGMEEPRHVTEILERARPYLPREGANGEMVLSMGKTIWYHEKGAAGVIDISPFTCMNGIVTESVYPRLSREFGGFPVRVFYFDGRPSDVETDLEIFMELARNYSRKRGIGM